MFQLPFFNSLTTKLQQRFGLKPKHPWLGPVFIAIAASLWAFDGVLRRNLYVLLPLVIVFSEHLVGTVLLLPDAVRQLRDRKIKRLLTKRVWLLTLAVALVSGLLGTLWFTAALVQVNFIPFSVVLLLQKLQPLFAITLAAVVLKERVPQSFSIWAALAIGAAYFVTFPGGVVNFATGSGTVMAALLAVGAAAAWGSGTIISKLLLQEVKGNVTLATTLRFGMTAVLAGAWLLLRGDLPAVVNITGGQWLQLVVIALSTGMVALWLYYRGLKQTEAKVSTIIELLFPLLAVVIDGFLYQSWLQPSQYLAAVVLLYAMYQVARTEATGK